MSFVFYSLLFCIGHSEVEASELSYSFLFLQNEPIYVANPFAPHEKEQYSPLFK